MCDNRCGCHRRRRCNICGFFNGFSRRGGDCFDRRRGGCFNDDFGFERFERCEKFERFDNRDNFHDCDRSKDNRKRDEFIRADFDGFFPEAKFEKAKRECCCKR